MAHKNIVFADLTKKKRGVILVRSHQMAVVVLAVVIFFLFDHLRGKRWVPLLHSQVAAVLQILAAHRLKPLP